MKKLLNLLYGSEIKWALQMDEMLRRAASPEGLIFECRDMHNMTYSEKEVYRNIRYLVHSGFICPNVGGGYSITSSGNEFLANGGYETEAKRSKNDIYAFRISVVAIVFSFISLVIAFFELCSRH